MQHLTPHPRGGSFIPRSRSRSELSSLSSETSGECDNSTWRGPTSPSGILAPCHDLNVFVLFPVLGSSVSTTLSGVDSPSDLVLICETFADTEFLVTLEHSSDPRLSQQVEVSALSFTVTRVVVPEVAPGHYHVSWRRVVPLSPLSLVVYRHYVRHVTSPRYFVLLAGDLPEADPDVLPWVEVRQEYPDMVVHLGDNVHLDLEVSQLEQWLRTLKSRSTEIRPEEIELAIRRVYGQRYRETWARWVPEIGNVSNVFGLGDRDLGGAREKWRTTREDPPRKQGPLGERERRETISSILVDIALESYDSYQSALTSGVVDFTNGRSWIKSWSVVGRRCSLVSLDVALDSSSGGARVEFLELVPDSVDLLVVGTSTPLLPQLVETLPQLPLQQQTTVGLEGLLDRLFSWLGGGVGEMGEEASHTTISGRPGRPREVVLVSSGGLFGGIGRVVSSKGTGGQIHFAITSAIGDQPAIGAWLGRWIVGLGGYQQGNYTFHFEKTTPSRNYITLDIGSEEVLLGLKVVQHLLPSARNVPAYAQRQWQQVERRLSFLDLSLLPSQLANSAVVDRALVGSRWLVDPERWHRNLGQITSIISKSTVKERIRAIPRIVH